MRSSALLRQARLIVFARSQTNPADTRRAGSGSLLRCVSSRTGAIDDDVGILIKQELGRALMYLIRWQIDRARQMRMMVRGGRQGFYQKKMILEIDLPL